MTNYLSLKSNISNILLLLPYIKNIKIKILVLFKGVSSVGELATILILLVAKLASAVTISIFTTILAIAMWTAAADFSYFTLLAIKLFGILLVVLFST